MASAGLGPSERLVLDASPLIEVDREKHRILRRLLEKGAQDRRLVVPSLVIRRLNMYKGKRKWAAGFVQRFRSEIETTLQLEDEYILFVGKQRLHPELANDDVQCLVIAKVRRWRLITHEQPMLRAATQQDIQCINNLDGLQRVLEGRLI